MPQEHRLIQAVESRPYDNAPRSAVSRELAKLEATAADESQADHVRIAAGDMVRSMKYGSMSGVELTQAALAAEAAGQR